MIAKPKKKTKRQRIKDELEQQDREWEENKARVLMLIANGEPLQGADKVMAFAILADRLRPTNHA
jgi:hypothetical protein